MNSATPALDDVNVVAADLCPTCQHPLSAHDAVGKRWCAATERGTGHRECMCSVAAAEARASTHY